MKPEDMPRFAMAIAKLAVNWGRQVDEALVEVYREVLADRRIEDVEAAVSKMLATTREFMPPAGVVRKAALAATANRQGVAFIEGTGWISLDGNQERNGYHPDELDSGADQERKRIDAMVAERPKLESVKGPR